MEELGYSKEEVIKMTKSLPTLYCLSIENIKDKIKDMVDLGYSKEEVIKMTKNLPSIYGYSIENIKDKLLRILKFVINVGKGKTPKGDLIPLISKDFGGIENEPN